MGMTNCSDGRTSSSRKSFNSITTESPQTKMAATAAHSHTASPTGKDQDPQEFLNGLMRDLGLDPNRPEAIDSEEVSAAIEAAEESPLENSRGSTIELTEETHSVELDHSPEKKAEPAPTQGWNQVVRKTRGVHHAKNQWQNRSGIKPLDKPLTGPNGEPLSPEEYSAHRLQMRCRELIGRTIEGELIPREKGKGYFIKWNRWRHDRVFMSCAVVESVLGPRPKPGTMIRCTINRLGPDHVPWNRQNPVSNEIEHWYIRPSGFMYPQPSHNQVQSHSAQPWEYAGVHERLSQTYPPMGYNESSMRSATSYSGNSYVSPSRSPVGSYRGQRSTALQPDARFSFADRPQGRSNRANSWRSPAISRRGSEQSLLGPSSLVRMDSPISPRFQRPGRSTSTGSLVRSNTERSKESQRSTGSNGSQN